MNEGTYAGKGSWAKNKNTTPHDTGLGTDVKSQSSAIGHIATGGHPHVFNEKHGQGRSDNIINSCQIKGPLFNLHMKNNLGSSCCFCYF